MTLDNTLSFTPKTRGIVKTVQIGKFSSCQGELVLGAWRTGLRPRFLKGICRAP